MIQRALKIAERSHLTKFKTGAVIVKDGKILSEGWSHLGTLKRVQFYSVHAELHAYLRAHHMNLDGAICYVANIAWKSQNITNGCPCICCAHLLREAGVEKVYHTTSKGVDVLDLSSLDDLDLKICRTGEGIKA